VLVSNAKELPSQIKKLLKDFTLIDVPLQDSFFHSIVCLVNPEYILKNAADKKVLVQKFKNNLSSKIQDYTTELGLYQIKISSIEDLSDDFKLYLCLYLDCNLIEFRAEPQYHFYDLHYQDTKSTIMVYQNTKGQYYPIYNSDSPIISLGQKHKLKTLYEKYPIKLNPLLEKSQPKKKVKISKPTESTVPVEHAPTKDSSKKEIVSELGLEPVRKRELKGVKGEVTLSKLLKFTLARLQGIATDLNIPIKNEKDKKRTKTELSEEILLVI
jgi:hypothetical protein